NYLDEKEIRRLERIVTMYLDYAQDQAERKIPMKMSEWIEKLDGFLKFNEYEILGDPGKISHETASKMAIGEYQKFRVIQDKEYESDFDKEIKRIKAQSKRADK
ncbi:MAG TPA: RhuM family protein, partial [Ignavibacteriales bacterium]|nr:RhuM family protein [Ignavibacteriales bacterium]